MASVGVIRTYLEMTSPSQLTRPAQLPAGFVVRQESVSPDEYSELYNGVGANYHWRDRRSWPHEQLRAPLADPAISVWVLRDGMSARGFFELARGADGSIEIAYFGLMPDGIGQGLGRALLTRAVVQAWNMTPVPTRVWLHTCTLDHPAALPNYLARGFRVTRTEKYSNDEYSNDA